MSLQRDTGSDIRFPLVAAWRDASYSRYPGKATRYHVVTVGEAAACSGMPVIYQDAEPVADVPVDQRCRRPGCREHWPDWDGVASIRRVPSAPRPTRETNTEFLERYVCVVCGRKPPIGYYMIVDEVWAAAGFGPKHNACFTCFGTRLGRRVTVADLRDAPINVGLKLGLAEADRLAVELERLRVAVQKIAGGVVKGVGVVGSGGVLAAALGANAACCLGARHGGHDRDCPRR